jgi:acyl-coenzyme A synthetase/AMP-(fatty) acid ligase
MILQAIMETAARRPEAPAVVVSGAALDFAALVRAVRERASALGRLEGAVVPVREAPLDALLAALAVHLAGGVPLLLAPEDATPDTTAPLPAHTTWLRATGGTTGAPRLIAVSAEQAHAAARSHARLAGLEAGSGCAVTVPPWTSYGWNSWTGTLLSGGAVHYVAPAAPRDLLATLAKARVRCGCTTPPVIRALARLPADRGAGARRAPLLSAAAAYPASEALLIGERHGVAVIDRYGSSEAGPIAQAREPGGVLWPAPDVTLHCSGEPLVLAIESPSVALGVVGGPPFAGVFQTADRVELTGQGSFRLLGRADHVVKRMGRLVALDELERLLVAQHGVSHARVRARPGALDVELVAEVVTAAGVPWEPAALASRLAEILPPWQRPSRIDVVSAASADLTKWRARAP